MFLKFSFLFITALTFSAPAWADGERGTRAEADVYASREAGAPALEEFSGGVLGGILAAFMAFVSHAVQAIVDLFSGDDPEAPPPGDQGRACPDGLPAPA